MLFDWHTNSIHRLLIAFCFLFHYLTNSIQTEDNSSSSEMLACCSQSNNNIRIVEIATRQEYTNFKGPQCLQEGNNRIKIYFIIFLNSSKDHASQTHVKEIPGSPLLISLKEFLGVITTLAIFYRILLVLKFFWANLTHHISPY